ncbi:MAG: hypothetical protein ACYS0G_05765 [Planctomycetota bacterium]
MAASALAAAAVSAQPCEPHWSDEFPSGELDSWVYAITVFDDGGGSGPALYAGGRFSSAGHRPVNRIAKWDGHSWLPLGTGMDDWVRALTFFDDGSGDGPALIAGGSFTTAGDVEANNIARWNGTAWSPLGNGLDGSVRTLAVFDDGETGPALYAGGSFATADEGALNRIAKWDGRTWSELDSGMDDRVHALAVFDDGTGKGPALYAGGRFTTAGGATVNHIAKWDGSTWSPLDGGVDGTVYALAVFDDGTGTGPALYVGGFFSSAGETTVNYIARWDGKSWSPLGSGMESGVHAMAVFDDGSGEGPMLYVGGRFHEAGGVSANHIAKWNDATWSPLGAGTDNLVWAIGGFDEPGEGGPTLFAGGAFRSAGGVESEYIARWDDSSWSGLNAGVSGDSYPAVWVVQASDDPSPLGRGLYAGGVFTTAGGIAAHSIARWNARGWSPLGDAFGLGGDEPAVRALAVFDDGQGEGRALFAGGSFTEADGVPISNIARWDGVNWSPLKGGTSGPVLALAVYDDGGGGGPALYAGGRFSTAGHAPAKNIARWDGTNWSRVGIGLLGENAIVRALAVFDDGSGSKPALYAGGTFTIGGLGIARWDGVSWETPGGGIPMEPWHTIRALTVHDDGDGPALYAAGYFTQAGEVEVSSIAKWDGASWSSLGDGVNIEVYALSAFDDGVDDAPTLYASGNFTMAGNNPANGIARWNGTSWSPLGEGVGGEQPYVVALGVFDDGSEEGPALYAGGTFTFAGGLSSQRIAKWVGCAGAVFGDLDGDGVVGIADLLELLASWGLCPGPPDPCPADLDGDGFVGVNDLDLLLDNWTEK